MPLANICTQLNPPSVETKAKHKGKTKPLGYKISILSKQNPSPVPWIRWFSTEYSELENRNDSKVDKLFCKLSVISVI